MEEEDGDFGISNVYIDKILRLYCSQQYKGVFSADTIPQELCNEKTFSLVANLSPANSKGTHFVCLVARKHFLLYIDPTGIPCTVGSIKDFMRKCGRSIFHNSRPVQDPVNSEHCGFYCILFCLYFDPSIANRPRGLVFHPPPRLKENDKKCVQYITEIIRRNEKKTPQK
jgi:hypothetical protein